jgi:Uncharacterised protein family UPF0547
VSSSQPPAPDPDGPRATKVCPDCAETILAAARKCRYCGYRFDQPRPGAALSLLERLGIWRRQRRAGLDEVLADWDISFAGGETIASFRYASVDGERGYVLVTDRRLVFVADRRRVQTPILEISAAALERVRTGRGGRQLIIEAGASEHTLQVGMGAAATELAAALAALAGTDSG